MAGQQVHLLSLHFTLCFVCGSTMKVLNVEAWRSLMAKEGS